MEYYTVYFIWKPLCMFWVVPSPITRSANNCIYSVWYLSHRYCYLPLSWKSWNWIECAVGGIRHPRHTQSSCMLLDIYENIITMHGPMNSPILLFVYIFRDALCEELAFELTARPSMSSSTSNCWVYFLDALKKYLLCSQ